MKWFCVKHVVPGGAAGVASVVRTTTYPAWALRVQRWAASQRWRAICMRAQRGQPRRSGVQGAGKAGWQ